MAQMNNTGTEGEGSKSKGSNVDLESFAQALNRRQHLENRVAEFPPAHYLHNHSAIPGSALLLSVRSGCPFRPGDEPRPRDVKRPRAVEDEGGNSNHEDPARSGPKFGRPKERRARPSAVQAAVAAPPPHIDDGVHVRRQLRHAPDRNRSAGSGEQNSETVIGEVVAQEERREGPLLGKVKGSSSDPTEAATPPPN
eukprot:890349-Prorocentrum_minimum.AAC.4